MPVRYQCPACFLQVGFHLFLEERKIMEMRKRIKTFAVLLAAVFALSLTACAFNPLGLLSGESSQSDGETPKELPENSLYDHGLEVISLMREQAGSEAYLRLAGLPESAMDTAKAAAADGKLDKVYQVTFPESSLENLYRLMSNEEMLDSFPESIKGAVRKRMISSVASMINGYFCGQEQLAAASICSAGKTFVDYGLGENVIYLYRYSDFNVFPAVVTFLPGEDGAVSANGMVIFTNDIFSFDEGELKSAIEEIGIKVEEVKP